MAIAAGFEKPPRNLLAWLRWSAHAAVEIFSISERIDQLMSSATDLAAAEARIEAAVSTATTALTTQASALKQAASDLAAARAASDDDAIEALVTKLNGQADALTAAAAATTQAAAPPAADPAPPADGAPADQPSS